MSTKELLLKIKNLEERNKELEQNLSFLKSKENASIDILLNSIPGFAFIKDINLNYVGANRTFCDLLKIPYDEIAGKTDYDIFPKDLAEKYIKDDKKVLSNGEALLVEEITVDANDPGYRFNVATRKLPWFDDEGNIIGLYGLGFDISGLNYVDELERAKEIAEESEHRFRLLTENSKDMIYRMTIPGADYEYVSPASIEIFGYTPEEFYSTPLLIKKIVHPDWLEYFNKEWQNLLDGKNPPSYEYQITHKSGEVRWLNQRNSLIKDQNGKPIAIEGNVTDITESKHVEEVLRAEKLFSESLISSLPGVFYLISEQRRFVRWNKKFEEATGRSAEEMARISPMDLFEGEDKQAIAEAIQRVFTHGQVEVRARFVTKDGKRIPYQFSGDKILVDGTPNLIGLGLDITAQHQADLEIVAAKEKAEESDRLKSAFLANMSHEIRTPMNGILGFTNLLKKPSLTGKDQKKFIDIIEKSGDRMLKTVNDIIDISKIEAGQVDLFITHINLNKQLNELYEFFLPEAMEKNIKLSVSKGVPDQQASFKSDKEKLDTILTNFVKNAIKFTHSGSIEFGYSISKQDKKNQLEFYIIDTGIGISKDRQSAIFNRFVQADIEDKQAYEGSGLGLAISKAYVEMLGGKTWVESEEGVGSQFYFTIPYNENNPVIPEKDKQDPNKQLAVKKGLKILIAEDDEHTITYLSIVLKEFTKELFIAKTGIEAVELCRANQDIDIVLMDIKIPGVDGYEATRQIREFNKEVFILAQTAYAISGDREISIQAGCDDYISKPINEEKLVEIILSQL